MDKDGIICCPCLCFLFPHFLSVKWRFPIKNVFQNQKIWKAEQKRIARFESWKHVCCFWLIWKMPFNDGDSIKIREIKDYHIFWVRNGYFLYKYLFRIKKYGRLKEIPIKEGIGKRHITQLIINYLWIQITLPIKIEQLTLPLGQLTYQTF